jgi:hypothetical protein
MRIRIFIAAFACALVAASAALAAPTPRPLLLGFQDEQSFLWSKDRYANLDRAASAHASVVRVIANWSQIAPTKPAAASNFADPAYHFEGLNDLIWQSELRGMRVLLTIWGTPTWASATHKVNAAPSPTALGAFCTAIGNRYNGRTGQPQVSLYSIWNEPNLDQFLHPQFDVHGKDVGPRLYAGMARACYGAIKSANPQAQVAIGDTSPRGHDVPTTTVQASHSPGKFAQLLAKVRPAVRFDAWAHHPYADGFKGGQTSTFRWPNVGIADLGKFELALRKDFGKKSVPLWVTEFAYQTAPEHPGALSYGRQADYLGKALQAAATVSDLKMFIWYVFRDTAGARWQSGLITKAGTPKPSFAAFTRVASAYDVANPTVVATAKPKPTLSISLLSLKPYYTPIDPALGVTYHVVDPKGGLAVVGQAQVRPDVAGQVSFPLLFTPKAKTTYTVTLDFNDIHGHRATRTAHLVVR